MAIDIDIILYSTMYDDDEGKLQITSDASNSVPSATVPEQITDFSLSVHMRSK